MTETKVYWELGVGSGTGVVFSTAHIWANDPSHHRRRGHAPQLWLAGLHSSLQKQQYPGPFHGSSPYQTSSE